MIWKRSKITIPILDELREGDPLPLLRCENRTPSKHVREQQHKTRNNTKVCFFPLFFHEYFFYLPTRKQVTHFTLFLSSRLQQEV